MVMSRPQAGAGSRPEVAGLRTARRVLPPVLMFLLAWWRISGASFWRDEAATLSAVRRPLPPLWHFLARTDVVHGTYYLLMVAVARALGTSPLDMRLPSALAVTATAAGVAALAARLAGERAGLAAGLMLAVLPVTSRYGQEARSYAFVMGLVVLSGYLLVRACDTGGWWWAGYAAALAGSGWMNLMSLLIIPANAVTVLALARSGRRGRTGWVAKPGRADGAGQADGAGRADGAMRRWGVAAGAGLLAVGPLLVLAWPQRGGTARFLAVVSASTVADLPGRLTGSWEVLPVAGLLAVLAVRRRGEAGRREEPGYREEWGRTRAVWLCLPWLVLPPLVLLSAGVCSPLYDPRYVLFCVPALAVLAGTGLNALAGARPWPWLLAGALLAGLTGLPSQLAYRAPDGHGDNIRLADQIVATHERPADAVLYQPPWWRQIAAAYPYGLGRLRDVSLARTPQQAGDFTGMQLPVSGIRHRLRTLRRVWLVEFLVFRPDPALGMGWRATGRWRAGSFVLVLYERAGVLPAGSEPPSG
jgi:mannosyltransferase